MFAFRKRKPAAALSTAMLASLAFVALAIWGWNLPLSKAGEFLLIAVVLVVALVLLAAATVALLKFLQRRRD